MFILECAMLRIVDLRSDTVTKPTPEMRQAMYDAEVGDDVYGEDPAVRELEELGAQLTGKAAGLFVASGTMGNQIAAMTKSSSGDEVICEAESHIFYYEAGGLARLAGVQTRPLTGTKGLLCADQIRQAIRPQDIHQPKTALICVENTHNRAGGVCYPLPQLAEIKELASANNIWVHMDGARVFNAAVAQNVPVDKITANADSVMFCLSKGLCSPVGSLLVSDREFIAEARRNRKMLGGGMRQAGILAAAGLVSLRTMVDRLADDHAHARRLGKGIEDLGFDVDMASVQTNIVVFAIPPKFRQKITAQNLVAELKARGIKVNQFGEAKVRMVAHQGIGKDDVDHAINVLAGLLKEQNLFR